MLDVNALPVPIDIRPETWAIDLDLVERDIAQRAAAGRQLPRVLIVFHPSPSAADVSRAFEICMTHRLYLIEDCSHAYGGIWDGKGLGSVGLISTFSTDESMALTCGGGGLISTGVPLIAERIRALASGGQEVDESTIHLSIEPDPETDLWRRMVNASGVTAGPLQSGSYRMPALSAALLVAQIERFPDQHDSGERRSRPWPTCRG